MIEFLKTQNEFLELKNRSLKTSEILGRSEDGDSDEILGMGSILEKKMALESELRDLQREKEDWHSEKRRDMGALVALGEEIIAIRESDTEDSQDEEDEDEKSSMWKDYSGNISIFTFNLVLYARI